MISILEGTIPGYSGKLFLISTADRQWDFCLAVEPTFSYNQTDLRVKLGTMAQSHYRSRLEGG